MGKERRYIAMNLLIGLFCLLFNTFSVSILSASVPSETVRLKEILSGYLKENYPWAEIEVNNIVYNFNLPDAMPKRIFVSKGVPGKAIFLLDYNDAKTLTVSADVKAYDWVVMSRRAMKKGANFQKEDVYMTLMDIARIPKDAVRSTEQIIGTSLARSIISNTPITMDMLNDKQVVKKGRRVLLLIESNGLSISTIGEIKDNSYVGDYVKVVNLESKRVIVGRLVDEGTVKVEF